MIWTIDTITEWYFCDVFPVPSKRFVEATPAIALSLQWAFLCVYSICYRWSHGSPVVLIENIVFPFPCLARPQDPPFLVKQRDLADPSQHSGTYPSVISECWHAFCFQIFALLLLFEDQRRQFETETNECNVCCQEMLSTYF